MHNRRIFQFCLA